MTHHLATLRTPVAVLGALGVLTCAQAQAASLQRVSDWGASGVPSTVSMYIYVPATLATKPPVLVCAHYCGGSAAAVFGQAQGGGIVKEADKNGFIMIFPQAVNADGSGRCWDVGSARSLTHDGGGDTQAIAQMVKYTIAKYGANKDRVYASGTSSGAMMTEALLATYPDVFKAGVEFAGVPAGCWAVGASSDGTWSGPCAGGQVTHTATEWGDIARKMHPGYSGRRPRIQLWHGDADETISYKNHVEAIKQWSNVLGLSADPTSTATLTYGTHQWTHQSWRNTCGYTVLDAWTELRGTHGVPDVNLNALYTVPFLGLDQAGLVDPEIVQCGGGGPDAGSSTSDAGHVDSQDGGKTDGGKVDAGKVDAGKVDAGGGPNSGGGGGAEGGQGGGDGRGSGGGGAQSGGSDGGSSAVESSLGCGSTLGREASRSSVDVVMVSFGLLASFLGRRRARTCR